MSPGAKATGQPLEHQAARLSALGRTRPNTITLTRRLVLTSTPSRSNRPFKRSRGKKLLTRNPCRWRSIRILPFSGHAESTPLAPQAPREDATIPATTVLRSTFGDGNAVATRKALRMKRGTRANVATRKRYHRDKMRIFITVKSWTVKLRYLLSRRVRRSGKCKARVRALLFCTLKTRATRCHRPPSKNLTRVNILTRSRRVEVIVHRNRRIANIFVNGTPIAQWLPAAPPLTVDR